MLTPRPASFAVRLARRAAVAAGRRHQSTTTAASVTSASNVRPIDDEQLRKNARQNFSSVASKEAYGHEYHSGQLRLLASAFEALVAPRPAASEAVEPAVPSVQENVRVTASAVEVDLAEAARVARECKSDPNVKVLLLMRAGEAQYCAFEREWAEKGEDPSAAEQSEDYPDDSLLTARGIGEVLNLSRTTASYCNDETGLVPDLVVVSPLRRSVQTAATAFPTLGPESVRSVPWICHGGLLERAGLKADRALPAQELERIFPGVDYSMYPDVGKDSNGCGVESKKDLLRRTDDFLGWLGSRDERIVAVSSHSTWFQSFCGFTLRYEPEGRGSEMFETGDMRAVVLRFD